MGEWREVKFQDLCKITRGASPRPIHDFLREHGIPWVKISDATASGTRFIEHTREYIKIEGKSKSVSVFPGDLILSNSATPGIPKFMKIDACVHDGWLLLREFKGLLKEFAYYLLINERQRLVNSANGSVFNNLKTDIIKNHVVRIPEIYLQGKIASILSSLDDKIELNRKMNETLEEMARAIFKSWFVDFDPVHAKARGEKPAGMPDEIADLFPSEFQFSEQLGKPIPKGWEVKPLKELIDFNPPRRVKKGSVAPYVEMSNLPENGMSIKGFYSRDFSSGSKFMNGDTLFARITPCLENGKTAYVDCLKHGETGWGSTEFIVMKSKPFVGDFVSYVIARSDWFRAVAIGSMNGSSGRQRASVEALEELLLAVPCNAVFDAYNATVATMPQKIQSSHAESQTLAVLRDSLLPKLISGEIEV